MAAGSEESCGQGKRGVDHEAGYAGEAAAKDWKTRWECIRRLQQAHAGRKPIMSSAVRKEDGELTQGQEKMLQRWHQHFSRILNQQSESSEEVVQQMCQYCHLVSVLISHLLGKS